MDKYPTTEPNGISRSLPQPIVLTAAETKQIAGGQGDDGWNDGEAGHKTHANNNVHYFT